VLDSVLDNNGQQTYSGVRIATSSTGVLTNFIDSNPAIYALSGSLLFFAFSLHAAWSASVWPLFFRE
jgi:hypothetical protein